MPQKPVTGAIESQAGPESDLAALQRLRRLESCDCFREVEPEFHSELQDTESDGWKRLLELVDTAALEAREEFAPFREMTLEQRGDVITLPASIGKLKSVRRLELYDSGLVRIPPEIGDMESLVELSVYCSHRLHWFPFEITRCVRLDDSTVSTRALYGNFKFRPHFPTLEKPRSSTAELDLSNLRPDRYGAPVITTCSVCQAPLVERGLHQPWISLNVGTDVLPLLVNACSVSCVARLPAGAPGYLSRPHTGGASIEQPPPL